MAAAAASLGALIISPPPNNSPSFPRRQSTTNPQSLRAFLTRSSLNPKPPSTPLQLYTSHHLPLSFPPPESLGLTIAFDPFLDFARQHLRHLRPTKLHQLLLSDPQLFLPTLQLLLHHGIPDLGLLLDGVNVKKVLLHRSPDHLEETIHFLKPFGWPDLVLRRPALLNLDLHAQLIPRIQFLLQLAGGDEAAVKALVRKLPGVLAYTVNHLRSHVEFFESVGLTNKQVFKIATVYPNVFSVSREGKLGQRIEFLQQCGLGADDIFRFLVKAPLFVSLSSRGNLAKKMGFLVKIGYRHRTREMAMAVGAVTRTSCGNLQMAVGLFLEYGLTVDNVRAMSEKHPQVLQYNHGSLEKKMEFLIEEMGREVGELLVFPAFLGYKLDDRIKRRYEAKRKIRGERMPLNKLLSVSAERFVLAEEEIMQHSQELSMEKMSEQVGD